MQKATNNSGLNEEEAIQYVSDVGAIGQFLNETAQKVAELLPAMWEDRLFHETTTRETSTALRALRDAVRNLEIIDGYIREKIKAAKKGQTLGLFEAKEAVEAKLQAEEIEDDEVKLTFTSKPFPEGRDSEEVKEWMEQQAMDFDTALENFAYQIRHGG